MKHSQARAKPARAKGRVGLFILTAFSERRLTRGQEIYRAIIVMLALGSAAFTQEMPAEYAAVLKTLGRQGDFKSNVLKVNIPRNDLKSDD